MTVRYYRDADGNYLGCHIAPDVIVTDPDTRQIVSASPAEAPWPGAIEVGKPPMHALMRRAAGTWIDTEASLVAKAQ